MTTWPVTEVERDMVRRLEAVSKVSRQRFAAFRASDAKLVAIDGDLATACKLARREQRRAAVPVVVIDRDLNPRATDPGIVWRMSA